MTVGQALRLPIYINREQVAASYRWQVDQKPAGARAALFNAVGDCGPARGHLCAYASGAPAAILVDAPGTYTLRLSAELKQPDTVNPNFPRTHSSTLQLAAEGNAACVPRACFQ